MSYNDQKTTLDRIGKKVTVKCLCKVEDCVELEDPYLEVSRENMEAVEEANRISQNND